MNAICQLLDNYYLKRSLFFRGQGTDAFEISSRNRFGHIEQSIHNPHLLAFHRSLSSSVYSIITSEEITSSLYTNLNISDWILWQSMLFDKSVGTKLHRDTNYLDTDPAGGVVGVWIALEDIHIKCGPFYVIPKSDKLYTSDDSYVKDIRNSQSNIAAVPNTAKPLLLKAGDAVFWNSLVLHGSYSPQDESLTRKSITAHYYPAGMKTASAPIKRFFSIYDHKKPAKTNNNHLKKATVVNPFLYHLYCGIRTIK